MPNLNDLKFGKQFFITQKTSDQAAFSLWTQSSLDSHFYLYSHPALHVTSFSTSEANFIGLGHFFDPRHLQATDAQILNGLGEHPIAFLELESFLEKLGGRWVMIATISGQTRIYHDAAGLKPVFYCDPPTYGLSIASQPALLEAIGAAEPDSDMRAEFERHSPWASWAVNTVPYRGVKQLLPNHTLDLQTGEAIRYWPKADLDPLPTEIAAESMAHLLSGMIKAAVNRRECVMSLTGGYDTRLLLACARSISDDIEFFTVNTEQIKGYDISIPRRIAKEKKLRYLVVDNKLDADYQNVLLGNVGGMFYGKSISMVKTLSDYVQDRFHITGVTSELNRCFYYKNGIYPKTLTIDELYRRSKFKGNPVSEKGIEQWFNEAPSGFNINLLDLFYWENRLGVWGSCGFTLREAVADQIPPMNCREFIQLGLATPTDSRINPYELIRQIIHQTEPSLLDYPFNPSWRKGLIQVLLLPWRVKRAFSRKL